MLNNNNKKKPIITEPSAKLWLFCQWSVMPDGNKAKHNKTGMHVFFKSECVSWKSSDILLDEISDYLNSQYSPSGFSLQ